MRRVHENRQAGGGYESNQQEVWADVASCLEAGDIDSETESITEWYAQKDERVKAYQESITLADGCVGMVALSGDTVLGMDLVDHPEIMRDLAPRILDSHIRHCAVQEEKAEGTEETVRGFLKEAGDCLTLSDETIGLGTYMQVAGDGIVGGGVMHTGRVRHLAAFA